MGWFSCNQSLYSVQLPTPRNSVPHEAKVVSTWKGSSSPCCSSPAQGLEELAVLPVFQEGPWLSWFPLVQGRRAQTHYACKLGDLNTGFQCLTTHLWFLWTFQNYLTSASFDFLIFNMGKINIHTLNISMRKKGNKAQVFSSSR